jgi:hypothetical protein
MPCVSKRKSPHKYHKMKEFHLHKLVYEMADRKMKNLTRTFCKKREEFPLHHPVWQRISIILMNTKLERIIITTGAMLN